MEKLMHKYFYGYLKLLIVLFFVITFPGLAQDDDFAYRPYPLILVHGFSSTPVGTWGARTRKLDEGPNGEPDFMISTAFDKDDPYDEDLPVAKKLVSSFAEFPDYWQQSSDLFEKRFLPWEEKKSYNDINHTYVETYCSYYRYESNDKDGIRYNKFGVDVDWDPNGTIDGPEDAYDISNGGQTQLLRIRVIQVLNEYYGDFKWVNDPSAKVRIACHSNGVVVVTNFLKNEENDEITLNNGTKVTGWNNDGKNGQGCHWSKIKEDGGKYYTSDGKEYKIDGIGFKLRDHVDFVAAFNGPFAGTPLGDKDGKPTKLFSSAYDIATSAILLTTFAFCTRADKIWGVIIGAVLLTTEIILMSVIDGDKFVNMLNCKIPHLIRT